MIMVSMCYFFTSYVRSTSVLIVLSFFVPYYECDGFSLITDSVH